MIVLVVILHVIVCIFLIAVILLQAGRGQGLSWGVFGGTPQSILGTKTASFLSRVTTGCAIIFLFTCIILNIVEARKSRSLILPQRQVSQLDFSKIKKALEEAEKNKAKTGVQVQKETQVKPTATQAAPQTVPSVPQTASQAVQNSAAATADALPSPPEKH